MSASSSPSQTGLLEDAGERRRVVQPPERPAGQDQVDELVVGDEVVEAAQDPGPELVLPRPVLWQRRVAVGQDLPDDGVDQLVAVAEVPVERHRAHPDRARDPRHRQRRVGLVAEQLRGRVDDPGARDLGRAATAAGDGCCGLGHLDSSGSGDAIGAYDFVTAVHIYRQRTAPSGDRWPTTRTSRSPIRARARATSRRAHAGSGPRGSEGS